MTNASDRKSNPIQIATTTSVTVFVVTSYRARFRWSAYSALLAPHRDPLRTRDGSCCRTRELAGHRARASL